MVVAAFPEIRIVKPQIFSVISHVARSKQKVEITYCSMQEPTPHTLIISPHSVVRSGRHWHVRGYCELNNVFRDFALAHISKATPLHQPTSSQMEDDAEWMTKVPVRLIAHPALSQDQKLVVYLEYFGEASASVTTCRGPLVKYFIEDLPAAVDITTQDPPQYLLAVENVKEIQQWISNNVSAAQGKSAKLSISK